MLELNNYYIQKVENLTDLFTRLCFNLVLKIDIFIHLGYNRDILMFRRL